MSRSMTPTPRIYKLADGLYFGRIYWISGDMPTRDRSQANDVKTPPSTGWSRAFLIDKGGKMVTLLCPYTLESFQVNRSCAEVMSMRMDVKYRKSDKNPLFNVEDGWEEWTEDRQTRLTQLLLNNWEISNKLALPNRDYDTTAMILNMIGGVVPIRTSTEADDSKQRGGKEADVLGLLKPVKKNSKRGQILEFFLPNPRSIREAMAEFSTTRSNILSHLFVLQRDHGIGYSLSGDAATILLPADCSDPFVAS